MDDPRRDAMHEALDPWHNPVTFAIPFFLLSIAVELAALKWLDHDDTLVGGYLARDSMTSIWMGLGSLVSTFVLKAIGFVVYVAIYDHLAPWHVPTGVHDWPWWIAMVVAVDFAYYWNHRFVHRARVGWAAHQAHHSSEYMNLTTALRQKWNPWWELVFLLPLPFLGIAPWAIYLAFGLNLVYQFFVHTETIRRLPRPIELVFNTPSHHRVHHGSDPLYLDRNYAGILIVWDRLFGTFQAERFRPRYGLTHPVDTHHLLTLQYGHYAALWRDVRGAACWRDRLGYLFMPPGWAPGPRIEERGEEPVPAR
jgi:sterol desaturase/sphingolipid hydroxylase (fatty acid hydroxylase superfamily)